MGRVEKREFLPNKRITFTRGSLKALPIKNRNLAADGANETLLAQRQRRYRHAGPARSDHAGYHFMSELHCIRVRIVMHHQ